MELVEYHVSRVCYWAIDPNTRHNEKISNSWVWRQIVSDVPDVVLSPLLEFQIFVDCTDWIYTKSTSSNWNIQNKSILCCKTLIRTSWLVDGATDKLESTLVCHLTVTGNTCDLLISPAGFVVLTRVSAIKNRYYASASYG